MLRTELSYFSWDTILLHWPSPQTLLVLNKWFDLIALNCPWFYFGGGWLMNVTPDTVKAFVRKYSQNCWLNLKKKKLCYFFFFNYESFKTEWANCAPVGRTKLSTLAQWCWLEFISWCHFCKNALSDLLNFRCSTTDHSWRRNGHFTPFTQIRYQSTLYRQVDCRFLKKGHFLIHKSDKGIKPKSAKK